VRSCRARSKAPRCCVPRSPSLPPSDAYTKGRSPRTVMVLNAVIFLIGLGVLYVGAEWLIHGASRVALHYGIRPLIVGLTIVALGTSLPEFFINFFAVFTGEHDLALGNIIGSNICNIALILGACSVIFPLSVKPQMLRKEYPMMMGTMVLFYLIALDGRISRWDGLLLVTVLFGVMTFLFVDAKRNPHSPAMVEGPDTDDEVEDGAARGKFFSVIGGMIGLAVGARMMIHGAVEIADTMQISHAVIGLTIVAIGTSLPELAASLVGTMQKESDLSVGNVMGSNLLNVLFVVGFVALISPMDVAAPSISLHFPVMIAFSALFLPLAWTHHQITRVEGGVLLVGFVSYMTYLVFPYI
jgi:cation:H+ antiporter